MSISGDLLGSAVPARLLCHRGSWVLELVKLVPVDRDLFQPKVQRLEGAEPVLQHLKRNGDSPALAAAAAQLIRAARGDEERAYEAIDGEWVPADVIKRHGTARPSAPPAGDELLELRAEVAELRASQQRMLEKLAELESMLSPGSYVGEGS